VKVQSITEGTEIIIGETIAGKVFGQSTKLSNINDNTVQPEYALYILVGCKITYWIIVEIFKFTNNYETTNTKTHEFLESLDKLLSFLKNYTISFINLQNQLIESYNDFLYYDDKSLLKRLLSLKIKYDFAIEKYMIYGQELNNNITNNDIEIIIVKLFHTELTELHLHFTRYCLNENFTTETSSPKFFHYKDEDTTKSINEFINIFYINNITIYANLDKNDVMDDILLKSFVTPDDLYYNYINMAEVQNTKFRFKNDNSARNSIKNINDLILTTCDVELIYWLQESVFDALMKKILIDLTYLYNTSNVKSNILKKYQNINKIITDNYSIIPPYWIFYFYTLSDFTVEDVSVSFNWSSFSHITLPNQLNYTLSEMLALLNKVYYHLDTSMFCYKYYSYIQIETDKYYIPYVNIRTISYQMDSKTFDDTQDNLCKFLNEINSICYDNFLKNGLNEYEEVTRLVSNIQEYFFKIIINFKINDFELNKIAFNVVIMLVNLNNLDLKSNIYQNIIIRVLNVIITEIEIYRSKYCKVSNFKFLSYNNSQYTNYNEDDVNSNIIMFLEEYSKKESDVDVKLDYDFFNIKVLYNTYIKDCPLFEIYGEKIHVNWKAKKQTFKHIILDYTNDIVNYASLFSRYDLYIKFHIAVIYYEIRICLKAVVVNLQCFDNIKHTFISFLTHKYPQKLQCFLLDINDLLKWPNVNNLQIIKESKYFNNIKNKIERQFEKFNIVFVYQYSYISIAPYIYTLEKNKIGPNLLNVIFYKFKQFYNLFEIFQTLIDINNS